MVLRSPSHLPDHSHLSPHRVWLGTPGGLGRKVAPIFRAASLDQKVVTGRSCKPRNQPTHTHPQPSPDPSCLGVCTWAPQSARVLGERLDPPTLSSQGCGGTGSGWCRVTSARLRTKALLCGNPRRGHGEGEGSQSRVGTWPRDVLPRCGLQGRAAPGVAGRIHSLGWGH